MDQHLQAVQRIKMNKNRYYTLLWLIQFDDMQTREDRWVHDELAAAREYRWVHDKLAAAREDRWVHDKLAAAREFFEKFNENCAQMMIPSEFLAIDERLYPYRGGTVIKQYNPNKPAKYGLLYRSISDSKFPYTYDSHAYGAKPNDINDDSRYVNTTDGSTKYLVDNLSLLTDFKVGIYQWTATLQA